MGNDRYDVFFFEAFQEESMVLRELLPPSISAGFTEKTIQETVDQSPPASLVSIRTQSVIPEEWQPRLKGILSRSTGYDHLRRYPNIPCGYLPYYCARAVAEQAMLLWMALLRKLPRQRMQFLNFNRNGLTGSECSGKTLLVVGVGNIGIEVVRMGEALGMRVLGVDIDPRYSSVSYADIDEALPQADVVVCAMRLNESNIGYFHNKRLRKMKKGAIFINIARGEFCSTKDLLNLLNEGHLGGVGLDVYPDEQDLAVQLRSGQGRCGEEATAALALARNPQAILTPHNAFNTAEAIARKGEQSVQQIEHFLKHGHFLWVPPQENTPRRAIDIFKERL